MALVVISNKYTYRGKDVFHLEYYHSLPHASRDIFKIHNFQIETFFGQYFIR